MPLPVTFSDATDLRSGIPTSDHEEPRDQKVGADVLSGDAPEAGAPKEGASNRRVDHLEALYRLSTDAVRATDLSSVYTAAVDAIIDGLGADRASLLLFDEDGVIRFKAARGLSETYMEAVEGHTPWSPDTPDPRPILVPDVRDDTDLRPFLDTILSEGIRSLAFVPLRHDGRVLGKFMAYFDEPHIYTVDEARFGEMIANHLAIVIARRHAENAREALHAQRESERAQFEAIVRHIPLGIAIFHPEGGAPRLQNEAAVDLWADVEPALRKEGSLLGRLFAKGEVILDADVPFERKDGSEGCVSISGSPIRGDDGMVSSAVVLLEDVSVRKRTESALRFLADATLTLAESLDYQHTLQKVAELMVPEFADWCNFDLINEEGDLQLVSIVHSDPARVELARSLRQKYPPSLESPTGIGQVVRSKQTMFVPDVSDEMLVASARDEEHLETLRALQLVSAIIVPLVGRGRVIGALTLIMAESGRHYESTEVSYVEELAQSCALAVENAHLYEKARREIVERQKVEAALRDSEERYRMLSEATSDYIFSYRLDEIGAFELEWISDSFERITGYTRDDIKNRKRWSGIIHPDDLEKVSAFSQRMHEGERQVMEHRILKKDGQIGWLRIYGRPVIDEADGTVKQILGAGQDITARKQTEQELQDLAENLERRIEERTRALESANDRLRNEVLERSRAEQQLARANAALRTSNRELQDFAYVASHDLQEPLRKIQSFADLLRSDYGSRLDEQGQFYIQRMQTAAERMSDLIKGLLNYSRVRTQGHPFQMVDLKEVVRDVLSDLEITIAETRGSVSVKGLSAVEADPTQMRQLFQNLIGNALKFRDRERPPVIRIVGTTDGPHCRIEITDNGIGFGTQYSERIFAPFQRLHGRTAYPGTGMGLAICRRIVERHSGSISATATPSDGATFAVTLPLRQEDWSADLREVGSESTETVD